MGDGVVSVGRRERSHWMLNVGCEQLSTIAQPPSIMNSDLTSSTLWTISAIWGWISLHHGMYVSLTMGMFITYGREKKVASKTSETAGK